MQLHKHLLKSVFGKAVLATAALSGFLLLAGAPSAKANDFDDCNRRTAYSDWRLHESVEHSGYYSPQANYWRHERHEAYERLDTYRRRESREHRRYDRDRRSNRDRNRD
jgi:hypothetical protein